MGTRNGEMSWVVGTLMGKVDISWKLVEWVMGYSERDDASGWVRRYGDRCWMSIRMIAPLTSKYSTAYLVMVQGSTNHGPTRNSSPKAMSRDHAPSLTLMFILAMACSSRRTIETCLPTTTATNAVQLKFVWREGLDGWSSTRPVAFISTPQFIRVFTTSTKPMQHVVVRACAAIWGRIKSGAMSNSANLARPW